MAVATVQKSVPKLDALTHRSPGMVQRLKSFDLSKGRGQDWSRWTRDWPEENYGFPYGNDLNDAGFSLPRLYVASGYAPS